MKFVYHTNCGLSKDEYLAPMVETAKQITYKTLLRHIGRRHLDEIFEGYNRQQPILKSLARDYAVSFYRSTFRGVPCYFVDHSAIEWIFIPLDKINQM